MLGNKFQEEKPRERNPPKNLPGKETPEKISPEKVPREKIYPKINLPGRKRKKLVLGYLDALHGETKNFVKIVDTKTKGNKNQFASINLSINVFSN